MGVDIQTIAESLKSDEFESNNQHDAQMAQLVEEVISLTNSNEHLCMVRQTLEAENYLPREDLAQAQLNMIIYTLLIYKRSVD